MAGDEKKNDMVSIRVDRITYETLRRFLDLLGSEIGERLAICPHCGKEFATGHLTGRRSSALYCASRCRVAAWRKRQKAA